MTQEKIHYTDEDRAKRPRPCCRNKENCTQTEARPIDGGHVDGSVATGTAVTEVCICGAKHSGIIADPKDFKVKSGS